MKHFRFILIFGVLFSLPGFVLPAFSQWELDLRLTYDDSVSGTTYNNAWCVAATGDTVHIVWVDGRDGNAEIYTKRSLDGGASWGPDTRLTYNAFISQYPSVAASGSNVHLVWWDTRDGNDEIYYKGSSDGGISWGPDTRLTNDSASSESPSVAASGSNVYVAWYDYRDGPVGNREIYAKRSSDGGLSWGPDTRLTNNSAWSIYPSVAATGSNVLIVWEDTRDGNAEIYAKLSTDWGVSWGPDNRLTDNWQSSLYSSIALSGSDVQVVWNDSRTMRWEIYTKRSSDGGASWGPDTRLTYNSYNPMHPSVAVSGSYVHVVWFDERDTNREIYTKRSSDGGISWGPDTRLTNDSAVSEYPSVAASGLKVHVVWQDNRDGNFEIYYKRDPTGSGVEEKTGVRGQAIEVRVIAWPTPFSLFTQVPGHKGETFSLYDISGRKVGIYKGDRIGWNLGPGVYFLRPEGKNSKPVRVVKVR